MAFDEAMPCLVSQRDSILTVHFHRREISPTAPIPFERQGLHVMAKPIGPICNLDCEYCYYLHKEALYPSTSRWRMPSETLRTYIRQYIEAQPSEVEEITFAWQGGEPTLLGRDFFQNVVAIQKEVAPPGVKLVNALQTNGVLLDEAWVDFFAKENFLIGLSIDGPAELHDRYRYDKKGRGTFSTVLQALHLLKKKQVEFNALVVINRHNGRHGKRVYTYLRDNGVEFLQFIPIVEQRGIGAHAEPSLESGACQPEQRPPVVGTRQVESVVSSRSVLPRQFGKFLIEVFEEWVRRDVGRVFVQIFDQALSAWMDIEPSLCLFRRQCGRALAIEHNGDLYCCDHFVEPDWLLGNIHDCSIREMANSPRQRQFAQEKESGLPDYCINCEVRFACRGECPKNRILATPEGEGGLNYLCEGYRMFFNHIDPYMRMMSEELHAGRAAANVMGRLKGKALAAAARPGENSRMRGNISRPGRVPIKEIQRNDPCPCGSGRKFKKCCGTS